MNSIGFQKWFLRLGALIMVVASIGLLYGGLDSYFQYKDRVQKKLVFNEDMFHFFVRENLKRTYQRLSARKVPETDEITSVYLFVDEHDLYSLDENLPESGKTQFISGHIRIADDFESEAEFRYRGGLALHWAYDKKSFRVKLPDFSLYRGHQSFNLVNPSTLETVIDWVSYGVARETGLLTPEYFPVRLYVNDEYTGIRYFLSQVDESFLRNNDRMPGSIYSGDTTYVPDYFGGTSNLGGETVYPDEEGFPAMWADSRLWEKDSARNAERANDRRDIDTHIAVINEDDQLRFMDLYRTLYDHEKFNYFWAIDSLFGSYHHDNFHNHKIYFDPYLGRFEPIEWDIRFWANIGPAKDPIETPFLQNVKLNPILEYERDLVLAELMEKYTPEVIISRVDAAVDRIEPELRADPLRQAADPRYHGFSQDKVVPFSMDSFRRSIEDLKLVYKTRYSYLETVLDFAYVEYSFQPGETEDVKYLTVSVSGNSPVILNISSLVPGAENIHKVLDGDLMGEASLDQEEILYPGRVITEGNVLGRGDSWALTAFGKSYLRTSPINYLYRVTFGEGDLGSPTDVVAKNAVTGTRIDPVYTSEIPDDSQTASMHPWELNDSKSVASEIVLSDEIILNGDTVYDQSAVVSILPGTKFLLGPGASIFFYGKVAMRGTEAEPISFSRLDPQSAWGSIVIQSQAASGSVLEHINVSGGSVTTKRLIDYTAMLNVHDLSDFEITSCFVSENSVGDDALHVSYATGVIKDCDFRDTAFDAIDIDIANVELENLSFRRIGNDGLDIMTASIDAHMLDIVGTGDKCISAGENSDIRVSYSILKQCAYGIAVKDGSLANLEDALFGENSLSAISLYRKNPRYAGGGFVTGMNLYGLTFEDVEADEASEVKIPADAYKEASMFVSPVMPQ